MRERHSSPVPAIGDPGSVECWTRFLYSRVEQSLTSFLEGLRADALNRAQAVEGEVRHWTVSLAVALLEARRRGADRSGLLELHQRIQLTPPDLLEEHVGVPRRVLSEGSTLLTRQDEFSRIAEECGVSELFSSYRDQESRAVLMGRSFLLEASREQEHFRNLVRENPIPFLAQAYFDRGDGPSRVLLSLCLLRGFRLPESAVPFVPQKPRGKGRRRTRHVGLVEGFLRLLPPSGERPGNLLEVHAGPLGPRARERAYRAASGAVGLDYLPSRGEVLVRLLAAAGDENSIAALAADGSGRTHEELDAGLGLEDERRRRHGVLLKTRVRAVERECLRLLECDEFSMGESVSFTSLEFALRRSGQLLGKEWQPRGPIGSAPASAWRLADPRMSGVEDLPPPTRG